MLPYYENSWALLIGIGQFASSIPPLINPEHDIENLAKILNDNCDFPQANIIKLKNSDAKLLDIKEKIDDLSGKISDNDRLLVYFSGHGETRTFSGRIEKKIGYLVPYDAKKAGGSLRYNSLMEFDELIKLIYERTKARQNMFIFDCCFSGIARLRDIGDESEFEKSLCLNDLMLATTKNKSVQIITAGGENEKILDSGSNPDLSILNDSVQKFVMKANPHNFTGGIITGRNLAKEINLRVGRRSVLLETSQTPRFSLSTYDGEGEFIFKKFTDEEIKTANRNLINYHDIEKIILNSSLKKLYSRTNLLGCLEIVEDKIGTEYSFKRLQEQIYEIIDNSSPITEAVKKIIEENSLDGLQQEALKMYVKDNMLAMGLSRSIFKPRFIDVEMDEILEENTDV